MKKISGVFLSVIVFHICFVLLFSACSLLKPENELALELVVRASTARLLEEKPSWISETFRITEGALLLLEADPEIILDDLEKYVISEIKWDKLLPEEQEILKVVISTIKKDIIDYFDSKGYKNPELVNIRVANILLWINQTAQVRM